jgi:hypothetical protein
MSLNWCTSKTKTEGHISEQEIRAEVSRLIESAVFVQSDRLRRFLCFTVETTLAGNAETLKEYLIGTEVYGRKPPYNPSVDSIVRSEARRLRSKLRQYYESVGKDDPIFIYYRSGSYVPVFRLKPSEDGAFRDRGLGDLLSAGFATEGFTLPLDGRELDVQIIFEGTVRVVHSRSASPTPTDTRLHLEIHSQTRAPAMHSGRQLGSRPEVRRFRRERSSLNSPIRIEHGTGESRL